MPVISKAVKTQDYILELLLPTDGMTVDDIVKSTGYSKSLVRQQLDILVARAEVIADKKRQPYLYTISEHSPTMNRHAAVDRAKRELYNKDSGNTLVQTVRTIPKDQWQMWIEPLRILAQAIEELEREGKLIETLEDAV